jgi:sugar lactone lactonase YvrE
MSLTRDGAGNIWVGTEGNDVWRFNPYVVTNQWKKFTVRDGLGDDYAYSVAVDQQGRVWVGHLNHGVSVYNGTRWKNYDVPFGPIGERIFKIAICPVDGDVWMGTSAGLTRYSVSKDTWQHYTRSDGLPGDQISALAFDAQGNIYVGTQCDGIGMASRASDYQDWKQAPLADQEIPTFAGFGLPSKLINDLLAASDGTIYAATDGGLAWSHDGGATWQFRRGKDFVAKMKGLAGGPPKGWSARYIPKDLPPEDYVTCLAEDDSGAIWADFRQHGLLALSGYSYEELKTESARQTGGADYGRAILPMPDYRPWLASYGKGLLRATEPQRLMHLQANINYSQPDVAVDAPFPSPARKPDLTELNALLKEVQSVPVAAFTNGEVMSLEDDWRTEGQWIGRYGRFWIVLCANWSPKDDVWGAGWDVQYDARMGLNHAPGDSLRYWVHWLATADNRCLEMSPTYLDSRIKKHLTTPDKDRRESEWDDHGETYPMTMDGPHIYCSLSIPAGLFYLSLYEIDPNGHSYAERCRDYQISIRPHPGRSSLDEHIGSTTIMRSFYDIAEFDQKPELAHARAHDFWGGVYKRFLVRGPAKLTIQVNRNYSFNTILPGVMLDLVDELPPPYYQTRDEWERVRMERSQPQAMATAFAPATDETMAAQQLAAALKAVSVRNPAWWAENKRRIYLPLLRWQLADEATNHAVLATSCYQLNLFADWEKQLKAQGITPAREIEKALRWDGVTYSCAGMGNQMVRDYLKAHPEKFGGTR